jgi:pimeloyl-ACP methyl ester carboxylesterase
MRPRLPRVHEEVTMTRRDIEFDAEGVTLRGRFYPAQGATGSAPTVVMAHGFSAVKEMYLDSFAEVFSAAGLGALVFDNRNFGASDGSRGRRSTRGGRFATTGTRSRTPPPCPRSTRPGSGSGAAATLAATCSSSGRSTGG